MRGLNIAGYLARIGAPDTATLAELQHAHLLSIPFENLSIHLGEPLSLDLEALAEKVISRRRGGFCYELNGLFAVLLRALGHDVELLAARVHGGRRYGPPRDHLTLRVGDELLDVGFGAHSTYPLRLDTTANQSDPGGTFRVTPAEHGEWEVRQDGRPVQLVSPRPHELHEFAAMCWWQSHAPGSHFVRSPICSRLTQTGRVSLQGRRLIETDAGRRTERELDSDDEILAAYRERFGIVLDRVPGGGENRC